MPYLHFQQDSTVGSCGCGSDCGCSKSANTTFLGQPSAPTQSTAAAFRFQCLPGCAPHAANQCRAIVRRAVRGAIQLAENAASRLEARNNHALGRFRTYFGDPLRPVPWANNQLAADLVAYRFRAAAHGFRTRVPHIRCAVVGPGVTDCRSATANALVRPRQAPSAALPLPRNTIFLCPPFWGMAPHLRAGVVLHEMLHLLFWEFFGHHANLPRPGDPEERRRDNSHCYEAFALEAAGRAPVQGDIDACEARPF